MTSGILMRRIWRAFSPLLGHARYLFGNRALTPIKLCQSSRPLRTPWFSVSVHVFRGSTAAMDALVDELAAWGSAMAWPSGDSADAYARCALEIIHTFPITTLSRARAELVTYNRPSNFNGPIHDDALGRIRSQLVELVNQQHKLVHVVVGALWCFYNTEIKAPGLPYEIRFARVRALVSDMFHDFSLILLCFKITWDREKKFLVEERDVEHRY